jgi:fumarate hydratase class II
MGSGRTHLMDAVPIRLGQEFSGYARMIELAKGRIIAAQAGVLQLPLGGTAVGTGLGAEPAFAPAVIARVASDTGLPLSQASNLFEALATRDGLVALSATLRSLAISLTKIANDLRWLASGPTAGLGELRLPALQPGSSLMPGKVNPVMAEMVVMVAAEVIGHDTTIAWSGASGTLELNAMTPVIASALLQSITILSAAARLFATRCVNGIEADEEHCRAVAERSPSLVTALAEKIGYDRAAVLGRQAIATGKTIRQLCREQRVLPEDELDRLLDLKAMTGP